MQGNTWTGLGDLLLGMGLVSLDAGVGVWRVGIDTVQSGEYSGLTKMDILKEQRLSVLSSIHKPIYSSSHLPSYSPSKPKTTHLTPSPQFINLHQRQISTYPLSI